MVTLNNKMSIIKHPISIGIILIVGAFVLGRFGFELDGEPAVWIVGSSVFMFLGGLFTLKAYWQNNVSDFNTQFQGNINAPRYHGRF